jgi:hypothetical protein
VCKRKLSDGQTCQKTFATEANSERRRSVRTQQVSIRYLGNEMIRWWYELSHPSVGDERIVDWSADGYFRCPAEDLQCRDSWELWRHADRHHPTIPRHASPPPLQPVPLHAVQPQRFLEMNQIHCLFQQPETVSQATRQVLLSNLPWFYSLPTRVLIHVP